MSDRRGSRLTEEEARALWRRAAELQAEAARRLEERSRSLAGGEAASTETEESGYALADVRAAAVEAGISEEFVGRAMTELEVGARREPRRVSDDLSELFLGPSPREIVVSRVLESPPPEVYRALQRLLPTPGIGLVLRDTRGGHPLEGGVLVLDPPPITFGQQQDLGYELRGWADVKEVHLSLRPLGESGGRTEVTLRAPLGHSRRTNTWIGGGFVGAAGGLLGGGTAVLGAAGASSAALSTFLVVTAAVTAGAVALASTALLGSHVWRSLWHYGLRRGEAALEGVLGRLAAHLTTGGMVGSGEPGWPVGLKDEP